MAHYVALKRIQYPGPDGARRVVMPRSDRHHGVFEDLPEEHFEWLQKMGAVRLARREEVVAAGLEGDGSRKATAEVNQPDAERRALEAEADRLGVKYRKNVSDDVLRERIAEAQVAGTSDDSDDLMGE